MHLVTLGTGTVAPSPDRTAAAYWIFDDQTRVLVDCGPGATHRLAHFGLPWESIDHLLISHFHADHICEIPALIFALQYGAAVPRSRPLTVWGPTGLQPLLEHLAAAFGTWIVDPPDYAIEIREVRPKEPVELGSLTCEAFSTPHTDESIAWSVRTGGAQLVYTGDTGQSGPLADWAAGCDLLLAECSLPESMALEFHLTPRSAAELAQRAGARRLVLTHLYPPVENPDPATIAARYYEGDVVTARDGDRFEIEAG